MSERIYAAITNDLARRMRNWARANAEIRSGTGCRISSCYSLGVRVDRYVSSAPPMLLGEASDTSEALLQLPHRYRQAVEHFWQYEGRALRWHARAIRFNLDYHTFEAWVMRGHELLVAALAVRNAAYHARVSANACLRTISA